MSARWPGVLERQEMLEEAIAVIRLLWRGGLQNHRGRYFTVENARLYTLPPASPPIVVAAGGKNAAQLAGRVGDGLAATSAKPELIREFDASGGAGKPRYAELTVCWAKDEAQARRTAREVWPIAALASDLHQELPLPSHFEGAAQSVTEEMIANEVPCGPDPETHLASLRTYADAGFDHLCIHQVGPDQEGFMRFYQREVMPRLERRRAAA